MDRCVLPQLIRRALPTQNRSLRESLVEPASCAVWLMRSAIRAALATRVALCGRGAVISAADSVQEGEFGRTGIGGGESGTIIPSAVPTTSAAGHCEARLRLVNPPPSCSAACAMAMAPLSPTALHERSRAVSAPHCGSALESAIAPPAGQTRDPLVE